MADRTPVEPAAPGAGSGEPLGKGTRLGSGPSVTLAETAFKHELDAAEILLPGLSYADLAHVAGLLEARVIRQDIGRTLLRELLAVHPVPEDMPLDPFIGDLYNNRDAYLQARIGDLAGWIHLGRARREATTIAWQLAVREGLLHLATALSNVLDALVKVAEAHTGTLMPDFTYLHHAHPTTLAHYLLGFAYPFERDVVRVRRALDLVNRSPAGSGSVNGSRFPIDRSYLAALLGFGGIVEHTRDAMWAPDMATEVLTAAVTTLTNVDRLAEELQLWTTEEFGFVELDDAHSRTSVIMPQKKNPYALAFLRGEARHAVGRWVGVIGTALTPTGQPDNRVYAYFDVPMALRRASAAVDLLADVLTRADFGVDRMRRAAGTGYTYATDLCDYLTLTTGIDNRTAHRIVGTAVRASVDAGGRAVTADAVRAAGSELGIELPEFDTDEFELNLSPEHLVSVRSTVGGAGMEPTATMIADVKVRLAQHRAWIADHPLRSFADAFLESLVPFAE